MRKFFFAISQVTFFAACLSAVLVGCASTQAHRPLIEEILQFRTGYKGLTNRICAKKSWLGKCEEYSVKEYDLNDPAVRDTLVKLGFRCRIAQYRYKIDPDKPRFIRYRRAPGGLFKPDVLVKENPVDAFETKFLIDAGTRCYSEKTYVEGLTE